MKDDRILDCGHKPSAHSEYTTGTAHTQDGREICWACADEEQRADLLTNAHYTAYLASDRSQLTTWTNGKLATITALWKVRNNFAGYIWRFRAVDVHGQHWHGSTPGGGMYARMHKNKAWCGVHPVVG